VISVQAKLLKAGSRKEVIVVRAARKAAALAAAALCLALLLLPAAPGGAGEVGITGSVEPQRFEVTISPQVIDLSHRAGESAEQRVDLKNTGTIPAAVTLASATLTGLQPVDPAEFDPKAEGQADRCTLKLDLAGFGETYLVADRLTANPSMSPLNPGMGISLYVRIQSNRYCPGATLGGKIVLDVQPAP
jgi:hypothetical protein